MRALGAVLLVMTAALAVPAPAVGPAAEGAPAAAAPLARLLAIADGHATLHFATRPEVWGDGSSISVGDVNKDWGRPRQWRQGPLHLRLDFAGGRLSRVATGVGEAPPAGRGAELALGELAPAAASTLLLDLAERVRGSGAEELIMPATLARDVETWPRLLAIARNAQLGDALREQAVFWLGQSAAAAATAGLTAILDDEDADLALREQAIFALSQREGEESIAPLMEVARASRHPQLRERALFWLAQRDDPRVLALFEEILLAH
jgi:hypothetical protein